MPVRAPGRRELLFSAVLSLCLSTAAGAQITSPDQLCSPAADPCVVSTTVAVAANTILDFGDRALTLTSTGRLNSPGGNVSIVARQIQMDNGSSINLRVPGQADQPGGNLELTATDIISISGAIDVSGDSPGDINVVAPRFDVLATGSLNLSGTNADATAGLLDIDADEVNLNGLVRLNSGSSDAGGTVTATVTNLLTISGILETKGGENDGGIIDINCGGSVTINASAAIRLDATGFGSGGDFTLSAADSVFGPGVGTLLLQGTISSTGGGEGGDGGSLDIATAHDCMVTGKLNAASGADGGGGEVSVSCSEGGPGDMTMSAEIDVHGAGTQGAGGDLELSTGNGSIAITNKINASAASGGGGSVNVSASNSLTLADRISANGTNSSGGDVSLSANGSDTSTLMLTANGSINADGSGTEAVGGSISLDSCLVNVGLRSGGAQSATANGRDGSISITGTNRIQLAGKMMSGSSISLIYRDFDPSIDSTAVLSPAAAFIVDSSLTGCGTPQPTRTPTRTPTIPTPTRTHTRALPSSTPTRTPSPSPRPTPAGPNDANCDGINEPDESPGVIEGIFDVSFQAVCSNTDANLDGLVSGADLSAIIRNKAAD